MPQGRGGALRSCRHPSTEMEMAMRSEATIERDHYFNRRYLKRERMVSFIEQIELVKKAERE